MTVNILGTDYEIMLKDDDLTSDVAGYCDDTTKKIVIRKVEVTKDSVEDINEYYQRILRHEIVHAFIFESGLDANSEWAKNEEMVSWVANQFYKIAKVFKDVSKWKN